MPDAGGTFITTLALVGGVLLVAALLSGLIERSGVPQVAVFLAIGACVGASGLGLVRLPLDAPLLHVVAALALVLVLFTDAVGLDVGETRRHAGLALLVLGPGTLASAALAAVAGIVLLDLPVPAAIVLGAALASTDPVLLRGVLRHPAIPGDVRQALRIESGLNDAVLLPVILLAMGAWAGDGGGPWAPVALRTLLLGPAAGVAVGLAAIGALELVRRKTGVRRDYESLYSLGVAFLAYAAGEGLHGSGLLAAFAAGLTIALLDVELCDCFLEQGQNTAEMALLFAFVLLGSGPIWTAFDALDWRTLLFAGLVLLARPAAFVPSLAASRLPARSRLLIGWFGPKGLSSLLLALLPVFAGLPGADGVFGACCLVVLLSILLHGGSALFLGRSGGGPPIGTPPGARGSGAADAEQVVTIDEVRRLREAGKVVVVDARTERSATAVEGDPAGALRILPDVDVAAQAAALGIPRRGLVAVLCA